MKVSEEIYRWNSEDIPGWSLEFAGAEKAGMKLSRQNTLDPATPNSLQIIIPKDAGETVGK